MARRGRQTGLKALGPGHRQRNKNPKLSPYQRELKRNRLANQAPRPFVNASAKPNGTNKLKNAAAASSSDALNVALMYQKRDAPAKARGLMQYLEQKEERAAERKRQREEEARRKEMEEEAILAYRERGENGEGSDEEDDSDDDEEEEDDEISDSDNENDGGEEEEEGDETSDDDDDNVAVDDDDEADEMNALLEVLKKSNPKQKEEAAKKATKKKSSSSADVELESEEELLTSSDDDDDDDDEAARKKRRMILTHVPKNPSGKQLKHWLVKKDRLAYLDLKAQGDTEGCENLLKKALEAEGYSFIDPEVIKAQRKAKKEAAADEAKRLKEEAAREAQAAKEAKKSGKKPKKVKPVLEGELKAELEDLTAELFPAENNNPSYKKVASTASAPKNIGGLTFANIDESDDEGGNGAGKPLDPHQAFIEETAKLNLRLLKRKEKKHAKKSEKRRERTNEEVLDMEKKLVDSMNKKLTKKIKKEKLKEGGDANYRLHQQLARKQLDNLVAGLKRDREGGDAAAGNGNGNEGGENPYADSHDPNVVLKFQQYENDQAAKKVKRLSKMDEETLIRAVEMDEKGVKNVEKIQFGERVEAPPVFNVVPTMNNSFAKFAAKLGVDTAALSGGKKISSSVNTLTGRNQKVNGVAVVTSSGGIRAQQKKPGKLTAQKLAAKNPNIISTAARTDASGDMSLYERKRLAKLGLMEPVTEQRVNRSGVANGGEGNSAHNANEMELLRQRVMQTYHANRKITRQKEKEERMAFSENNKKKNSKKKHDAPVGELLPGFTDGKRWLPADRDY